MHAIPSLTSAAATALLLVLLGGCATADPLAQPGPTSSTATPNPDPEPDPDPGPGPDPDPDPPDPLPVETNEVRLTWVETGGASSIVIELPDELPYFALFSVDVDEEHDVLVESVALDPAGAFAVSDDGCSGVTVAPEAPCFVTLVLDVAEVGVYDAVLRVTPAGGSTATIPVRVEVEDDVTDEVDPDPDDTDDTDGTDDGTDEDTDGTDDGGTDEEGASLD
jgi:hypothetical protein